MSTTPTRLAWLGLNADGALLAGLAAYSGAATLARPERADTAVALGYTPPTLYLWAGGYVVAGLLMLAGFAVEKIGVELLGRLILCLSVAVATWRSATVFGATSPSAVDDYAILGIVVAFCAARTLVLLRRRGLGVVIGGE